MAQWSRSWTEHFPALWFVFLIISSVHYWSLPITSPELPDMARHPLGRWLFYLFLMLLCMAAAAVYTLAFWMGLAKLIAWIVQRPLRGAWRTVPAMAYGVWYAACGLAWLVQRGWCAVRVAQRRRRLARMPRGVVIDIEGVWLDEDDMHQRAG